MNNLTRSRNTEGRSTGNRNKNARGRGGRGRSTRGGRVTYRKNTSVKTDVGKKESNRGRRNPRNRNYIRPNNSSEKDDVEPQIKDKVRQSIEKIYGYKIEDNMFFVKSHPRNNLVLAHYRSYYRDTIPKVRGLIFDSETGDLILDSEGRPGEIRNVGSEGVSWADYDKYKQVKVGNSNWETLQIGGTDEIQKATLGIETSAKKFFFDAEDDNKPNVSSGEYNYFDLSPHYEGIIIRMFKWNGEVIVSTYKNINALETFTVVNSSAENDSNIPRPEKKLSHMLEGTVRIEQLFSELFKNIITDSQESNESTIDVNEEEFSNYAYIFILLTPEYTKLSNRCQIIGTTGTDSESQTDANGLILLDMKPITRLDEGVEWSHLLEKAIRFPDTVTHFSIATGLLYNYARRRGNYDMGPLAEKRLLECKKHIQLLKQIGDYESNSVPAFDTGDSFVVTERDSTGVIKNITIVMSPGYSYKTAIRERTGEDQITNPLKPMINALELFERETSRSKKSSDIGDPYKYEPIIKKVSEGIQTGKIFYTEGGILKFNNSAAEDIMGNNKSRSVVASDIKTEGEGRKQLVVEKANMIANIFLSFSRYHQRQIIKEGYVHILLNIYNEIASGLIKMARADKIPSFPTWNAARNYLEANSKSGVQLANQIKYRIIKYTPSLKELLEYATELERDYTPLPKRKVLIIKKIKEKVLNSNYDILHEIWKAQNYFEQAGGGVVYREILSNKKKPESAFNVEVLVGNQNSKLRMR